VAYGADCILKSLDKFYSQQKGTAIMKSLRQAAQQALEALEYQQAFGKQSALTDNAIIDLRQALAEQQEWTPDDTAYRPGGLPQPAQQPLPPQSDIPLTAEQLTVFKYGWKCAEEAHGIKEST
jgi:hypothetical protein